MKIFLVSVYTSLLLFSTVNAQDENEDSTENKTLKIGNFALRSSQQPGPLIGFGENIIDKNQIVYYFLTDYFNAQGDTYFCDAVPSILYGINERCTVFFNLPFAVKYHDMGDSSSGLEDAYIQFEYAYYLEESRLYQNQATFVSAISLQTGSTHKIPPTGFHTPTVFFGLTYNHTAIDWFYFTSYGVNIAGKKRGTKNGTQYLYQAGIGRNICNFPGGIFACMLEIDGFYTERNKIHKALDYNSGGNVIYATPSLFLSNHNFVVQLGAGPAVVQNLFGEQNRSLYLVALNVGWTY